MQNAYSPSLVMQITRLNLPWQVKVANNCFYCPFSGRTVYNLQEGQLKMSSEKSAKHSPTHYNDVPLVEDNIKTTKNYRPKPSLYYPTIRSNDPSNAKPPFYCDSFLLSKLQCSDDGSFTLNDQLINCFYSQGQSKERKNLKEFLESLPEKYKIPTAQLLGSLVVSSLPNSSLQFCNQNSLKKFLEDSSVKEADKIISEIKAFCFEFFKRN